MHKVITYTYVISILFNRFHIHHIHVTNNVHLTIKNHQRFDIKYSLKTFLKRSSFGYGFTMFNRTDFKKISGTTKFQFNHTITQARIMEMLFIIVYNMMTLTIAMNRIEKIRVIKHIFTCTGSIKIGLFFITGPGIISPPYKSWCCPVPW